MQSEAADFVPGAATWRSRLNSFFWRPTGAQTGRNTRVVFDSGPSTLLCENMTSSTKSEVQIA